MSIYIGPEYKLGEDTILQDIRHHCWTCGKRLAEVIKDAIWRSGDFVCIDCGRTYAPVRVLG